MFPKTPETPQAVARNTDPETSWAAARKASVHIRDSQTEVWAMLKKWGPICDEQLHGHLRIAAQLNSKKCLSPSGARTRRSELVALGLVVFNKTYATTHNGGKTREWRTATAIEFWAFNKGQESLL